MISYPQHHLYKNIFPNFPNSNSPKKADSYASFRAVLYDLVLLLQYLLLLYFFSYYCLGK